MPSAVLGQIGPGSSIWGIIGIPLRIHHNALTVQFTAAYPPARALAVNFSVQMKSQNALTIGYWTVQPALGFTINGVKVPAPQHIVYTPRNSIGADFAGISIFQGSTTMVWQYDVLIDSEISLLMQHFSPISPQVTLTYPNELGFWVQKTAYFHDFNFGTRSTVLHNNVALTFTGILPD